MIVYRVNKENETPTVRGLAADKLQNIMRHLRCVVSPPIIITKCSNRKHGNYMYDHTALTDRITTKVLSSSPHIHQSA